VKKIDSPIKLPFLVYLFIADPLVFPNWSGMGRWNYIVKGATIICPSALPGIYWRMAESTRTMKFFPSSCFMVILPAEEKCSYNCITLYATHAISTR
jgi:hypothetical protein